ncbi:potential pheromone-regulated membrane proteinPrm1 [Pseudozyma hubeiensis SY62]|uniref:Plasma membrane fusion protein PRM1 n=1 Tax=Pseudozyma hubeiensis (strain SY62) TaxID=1305764 RepID=R9PCX8_PSEHS|nr:potential pheromone-regulated membrane proteinPrm1 [Pseudozyma hubeiensis SY62]GAC99243.1 potential pheromone-regulated membrane proteinPrm1 [Pseudozyma hubeiensis SY62]
MLTSSNDAKDSVWSAKYNLLSACNAAESTASLAASFPHFLASTTNAQLAQSVTSTVHGAARVFDLSMIAIEKVLSYIVNLYKSLFTCFMELLVRGALAVVIEAVQLISQAITAAAQGIRAAIQDSISGVNTILTTAVGGINDVVGVFGQHVNVPHIAVPNLTALNNITLPHEIQDGLLKLNATLPTLQQLKQTMDALIETPFEEMRREVNTTLASFQFNHTVFPLPQKQNVTFCDRIDTSPLDELGDALRGVAKWGLVMLLLVAMVVMLIGAGWEWWKWQRELKAVEMTRSVWLAQHQDPGSARDSKDNQDILKTENLMSLLTISRHPLISHFRSYFANESASAHLQILLIQRLTHHYTSSIDTSLTNLSSSVIDLVNDHMRNASFAYSNSANTVILQVQSELNNHVFSWVNTTTFTMNATLNQFVDGITDTLTTTFGGTPFNAPLQTFVQCMLGQKVAGIEKTLTWIHDNAHVDFDMVPADVLMLKEDQQEAVLRPVRQAMLGDGGGGGSGVVGKVMEKYEKHLRQEMVMFGALVGVYAVLLLIGVLVVLYAMAVERSQQDGDGKDEQVGHQGQEKELRDGLQAGPSTTVLRWWSGWPKPSFSRFKGPSRTPENAFGSIDKSEEIHSANRRASIPHSNHSARTHITKDSISYPFQIHHSLTTDPPNRPRQPTPLREATSSDPYTVLSPNNAAPPQAVPTTNEHSSWLSFLASHVDDKSSNIAKANPVEEGKVSERGEDRFQRLFGCSPVTSPTAPNFGHHLSAPNVSMHRGKEERFRETLDLRPMQDWMRSKSPIPPTSAGTKQDRCTDDRASDIELTRSGHPQVAHATDVAESSYAFANASVLPSRPSPQKRAGSPQSISFYAW